MKKRTIGILIVIIGLAIILYPVISNIIASHSSSEAIVNYKEQVRNMTKEEVEEKKEMAREYNKSLIESNNVDIKLNNSEKTENKEIDGVSYLNVLNIGEVMGYVEIPKIDRYLPIYHGVSEDVLQSGVGHLESSSIPVGGKSTHAVLAGHTGLVRAKLFDDIDKLQLGDKFYIYVLDEKFAYQVDQIKVVLPEDTKYVGIEEDKEYVTLLTCVPYGINSHRLLVRGTRIEEIIEETEEGSVEKEEDTKNISIAIKYRNIIIICIIIGLCLIIMLFVIIKKKSKKNKH